MQSVLQCNRIIGFLQTLSPRGYFAKLLLFNCIKQVHLTVIYTRTKHDSCELLRDGDKVVCFVIQLYGIV